LKLADKFISFKFSKQFPFPSEKGQFLLSFQRNYFILFIYLHFMSEIEHPGVVLSFVSRQGVVSEVSLWRKMNAVFRALAHCAFMSALNRAANILVKQRQGSHTI
jgi:hypothetical protein